MVGDYRWVVLNHSLMLVWIRLKLNILIASLGLTAATCDLFDVCILHPDSCHVLCTAIQMSDSAA
jgi:hypothetical protein